MVSKKQAAAYFFKHGVNHPEACVEEENRALSMIADMKLKGLYISEDEPVEKVKEVVKEVKEEIVE